jgi:hypothetical protein
MAVILHQLDTWDILEWIQSVKLTLFVLLHPQLVIRAFRNIIGCYSMKGQCVGLTILPPSCADCLEIWEPQPPGTLRACQGLCTDCLFFIIIILWRGYVGLTICKYTAAHTVLSFIILLWQIMVLSLNKFTVCCTRILNTWFCSKLCIFFIN